MTVSLVAPGATLNDWRRLQALGLTQDLLPVVSDPGAQISPHSRMRDVGKTPSVFGDAGVVGLTNWPKRHTTVDDVRRWSQDSRLGICIQTRNVRALDVDVDDPVIAQRIADSIEVFLLAQLPRRFRSNSGKFAVAFRLPGDYRKRRMLVEGGVIEFLATGQQFVAVGTHPSGVRYQWATGDTPGLPEELPELTPDDFEALWAYLADQHAVEAPGPERAAFGPSGAEDRPASDDPVVEFLEREGWVTGTGQDGRRYVRCPWEGEHTTDTGITASTWFPAGSGGYAQGNYKCLHAHCEGRGRDEFLPAIGYGADDFEVLPAEPDVAEPWPAFERKKDGRIVPTPVAVVAALRRPDFCGYRLGLDEFRDEVMIADAAREWRPMTDPDYMRIRLALERQGFYPPQKELLRDSVGFVARENAFDSAKLWLAGLKWDGMPRVESFLTRYFGAEDSPYARVLSLYMWTALAGRVADPGCQVDIVPILEGPQGVRKSSGVAALVPAPEHFVEISLGDKDEDLARKMRGALVGEIAELDGLHRRDAETIKRFVTRRDEKWVPKYREFTTTYPRRLVLIGTTNRQDLLADETGNRRWAPIHVTRVDVEAIAKDRDQLWAEAASIHRLAGVCWTGAELMAKDVHDDYRRVDPWQDTVHAWLESPDLFGEDKEAPRGEGWFTSEDVLRGALAIAPKDQGHREKVRVSAILKTLGYSQRRAPREGTGRHAWRPRAWFKD